MASPETLCPKCGFTPIPERAEACPKCGDVFSFNPLYKAAQRRMIGKHEALDYESTTRGGLTGAVSANPGPAAAVLTLAAAIWLIRGAGLLVALREPAWLFWLAGAELVAATFLMANLGPAALFAQAVAGLHVAVAFVLPGEQPLALHTLLSALVGLIVIGMTLGEPSKGRRRAGLAMGVLAAAGAIAALAWATQAPPAPPEVIHDLRVGYQLVMPPGWKRLSADELAPHLPLPNEDLDNKYIGFGSAAQRTYGLLTISGGEDFVLLAACEEQLRRLGARGEATPLKFTAPEGLGKESLVFELRTASGALGRLGCGRVGKRFVALGVVVTDPTPGLGEAAFERLGATLTVR